MVDENLTLSPSRVPGVLSESVSLALLLRVYLYRGQRKEEKSLEIKNHVVVGRTL